MFSIRSLVLRFNLLQIFRGGKNRTAEQAQTAAVNEAANEKGFSGDALMKTIYQIFVEGTPKPQPRPRMARNGHVYNPHTADSWKDEIKAAFLSCRKKTITGPVRLTVRFSIPLPKGMKMANSVPIPHVKKPDTDNLLKSTMDSLTDIGVWEDDSQVYEILVGKYYTGRKTGAQIVIDTEL